MAVLCDKMNKTRLLLVCLFVMCASISWLLPQADMPATMREERSKIVIREVGNQLLLAQRDTISRILPVRQLESDIYVLAFSSDLSFLPEQLVAIASEQFTRAQFPKNYIIEVYQCYDNEVAYSFEINKTIENTIVPCSGRKLPLDCYTIKIQFIEENIAPSQTSYSKMGLLFIAGGALLFLGFRFRESKKEIISISKKGVSLGSFNFYPEEHKLMRDNDELVLSKKECELLTLFAQKPNEIIKREELSKKVWEDNGVIVGRSLDTYVSKLRKKLQIDPSIRLTNIHGVGYKLEIR